MGMTDDAAFSAFVSARSAGLLRTAYLLTHDEGLAEDLLQTALTKTWFAWGRLDETRSAMCAGCW
jgi:DNA-directed RNA polymerase specialized sigma24 family protein